jgi:hypothetical protein
MPQALHRSGTFRSRISISIAALTRGAEIETRESMIETQRKQSSSGYPPQHRNPTTPYW